MWIGCECATKCFNLRERKRKAFQDFAEGRARNELFGASIGPSPTNSPFCSVPMYKLEIMIRRRAVAIMV